MLKQLTTNNPYILDDTTYTAAVAIIQSYKQLCNFQDSETEQCTYSYDCLHRYYAENGKPCCGKQEEYEPVEKGEAYA